MKTGLLFLSLFVMSGLVFGQGQDKKKQAIHKFLDEWHAAAAKADADTYFGAMTENGIYLGTEAGERWQREEFREWAKKYFERGKAWDFKPYDRQIYFTDNGKYAWFEEKLDTWMGVCRGSGVLKYHKKKGWKIEHYNLAVTVDNDKIEKFLEIKTEKKTEK